LKQLAPEGTDWSAARALATHPRIADAARALGFGAVHDAPPTEAAVVAAIQRLM
jgi:uroporphyrinogen-III synthase